MRSTFTIPLILVLAIPVAAQEGKTFTNTLGMKFAHIEAGAFVMGQGDAPPRSRQEWSERDYDEAPAHPVKISKAFYLGIHEVTNAQYEAFDPAHKSRRAPWADDKHPVVFVSSKDAIDEAFWSAVRTTFTGSMTPAATRSSYLSAPAL